MLKNKTIAVVIPCYNEETQIRRVIETMPAFVDLIVAVNDKSSDRTPGVLAELQQEAATANTAVDIRPNGPELSDNPYDRAENVLMEMRCAEEKEYTPSHIVEWPGSRLVVIDHLANGGVGAAIASGYKYARDCAIDCTAVMAGDGQMDPAELESICLPVVDGRADYSKGNRLKHRSAKHVIPRVRFYGNSILSILTKLASGYWRVSDTQTGYTAISLEALENIDLHKIYKSYGMPNDLLVKLNIASFAVTEVPIKPVYQVGEQSKMKIWKVVATVSVLLLKLFFERLFKKYLIRDFHPVFLLYCSGMLGLLAELFIAYKWLAQYLVGNIMYGWLVILVTVGVASLQALIFAMWFDMQDNERLYV
ncbi:MAG: glycosyltransferase family 2 protein [Betaproteobacteria bacterium]|nr:glycosyltransferase family 2 protein [Betaproteobacteria bacterium]